MRPLINPEIILGIAMGIVLCLFCGAVLSYQIEHCGQINPQSDRSPNNQSQHPMASQHSEDGRGEEAEYNKRHPVACGVIGFPSSSVRYMDRNEGFFVGTFTAALFIATVFLWRSTRKLWESGEKQLIIAKGASDAAKEANDLTRSIFSAQHRPWISVTATITARAPANRERRIAFTLRITIENIGEIPANFVTNAFRIVACGQEDPVPIMKSYCNTMIDAWYKGEARGVTIFPGKPFTVDTNVWIDEEDAVKKPIIRPGLYLPMVIGGAFYKIGDQDIRYTGVVYNISVAYDDSPNGTFVFRIGQNDKIMPNTWGLKRYNGGDFAT